MRIEELALEDWIAAAQHHGLYYCPLCKSIEIKHDPSMNGNEAEEIDVEYSYDDCWLMSTCDGVVEYYSERYCKEHVFDHLLLLDSENAKFRKDLAIKEEVIEKMQKQIKTLKKKVSNAK